MYTIREGTSEDSDVLWSIRRDAVQNVDTGHYTETQIDAWSRRGDMPDFPYDAPKQYIPVGTHDTTIVGFGGVDLTEGEIRSLYVHPDSDLRVGSSLLEHMESVIREEGFARIALDATLNSVPFYHQHGYSRDEMVISENHGVELELIRMTKALPSGGSSSVEG